MQTFPINWSLPMGDPTDTRRYASLLRNTGGWKVECVYLKNSIPKRIEIRRQSGGDFVIGGDITVFRNGAPVVKKKIFKAVDANTTVMKITLGNANQRSRRTATATSITLQGEINISPVEEMFAVMSPTFQKKINQLKSLSELSTDFSKLLDPKTSCVAADVNLKCGSAFIPAHKFVLSSRSPVFAAMFANPMCESRENEVVIDDVTEPVLRDMVSYMYTGNLSIAMTTALDLLLAADKYQVLSLKRECCDFLKKNISHENVLCLLDLGDAIAQDLKSFAMDYICHSSEFCSVQNSIEWKALEAKKPALALEILSVLMKLKDEKLMIYEAIYD